MKRINRPVQRQGRWLYRGLASVCTVAMLGTLIGTYQSAVSAEESTPTPPPVTDGATGEAGEKPLPNYYDLSKDLHRWGPAELDGPRQTQDLTLVYKDAEDKVTKTAKPGDSLKLEATVTFHNPFQRALVDTINNPPEKIADGNTSVFRPTAKILVPSGITVKGQPVISFKDKNVKTHFVERITSEGTLYTVYFNYFEFDPSSIPEDIKEVAGEAFREGFPLNPEYEIPKRAVTADEIKAAVGDIPEDGDVATLVFEVTADELAVGDTSLETTAYTQSQSWADFFPEVRNVGATIYTHDTAGHNDPLLNEDPSLVKVVVEQVFDVKSSYGAWYAGSNVQLFGVNDERLPIKVESVNNTEVGRKVPAAVQIPDGELKLPSGDSKVPDHQFEVIDTYATKVSDQDKLKAFKEKYLADHLSEKGYVTEPEIKTLLEKYANNFRLEKGKGHWGEPVQVAEHSPYGKQPTDPRLGDSRYVWNAKVIPVSYLYVDKEADYSPDVYSGRIWVTPGTTFRFTGYYKKPTEFLPPIHAVMSSHLFTYARPSETAAIAAPLTIENEAPKLKIGNKVFVDENGDGLLNGSEKGLDNVTVKLYAGESIEDPENPLKETKTDNNGEYSFTDLNPGKYIVTFTAPSNYVSTKVADDKHEKPKQDSNRASEGKISVTLGDEDVLWADAGFKKNPPVEKPSIGTTVFEDKNNNGKQDEGELGIPGVVVELSKNGEPYLSTKTDKNGEYEFPNLDPDTKYTVIFKTPNGYTPTKELDDPSSDVNSNRAKNGEIEVDLKKDPVKTADAGFKKNPPVTPPVNPEKPEVPVKPIKPSHPKQPPEFFKPLIPCQPGKPCDPEKPGKPVKPTQPKQPAKPGQELPKTGEQATATGAYALAVVLMALAAYGVVLKQRKA